MTHAAIGRLWKLVGGYSSRVARRSVANKTGSVPHFRVHLQGARGHSGDWLMAHEKERRVARFELPAVTREFPAPHRAYRKARGQARPVRLAPELISEIALFRICTSVPRINAGFWREIGRGWRQTCKSGRARRAPP